MITHLLLHRITAKMNDIFVDLAKSGKQTKIRKEYRTFKYLAVL